MFMVVLLNIVTAALLLAIALVDYKTMEIPNGLNFALSVCAVFSIWVCPEIALIQRCIGAFCVSVPMILICLLIPEAFGGGDIKLLFVMGFYLGYKACLVGTFLGFCIGGFQAMVLLARGKVRYGERTHIAFGPALCAGLLLAQLFGTRIFDWYFGLF